MSKASDAFENEIVTMVSKHIGESLPSTLPDWMLKEGIIPGAKIVSVDGIGSKSKDNKTDVIIKLSEGEPIKISAKLRNADYFGNWYGHKRFIAEFGTAAFERMTKASTVWANEWAKTATAPYVGVSICFGRRSGKTGQDFLDIFTADDILTVARGFGSGDHVANCMYISNNSASTIQSLINNIEEITTESVNAATESFKVAHRPINPITERKKSEDLDLLPNPRKSLIFQSFSHFYFCTLVNRTTLSTCVVWSLRIHFFILVTVLRTQFICF